LDKDNISATVEPKRRHEPKASDLRLEPKEGQFTER